MKKNNTVRLIKSNQIASFLPCKCPITIDKRKDWGDNENNFQRAPSGAFLKVGNNEITHLVQPNEDFTAPIGWRRYHIPVGDAYEKLPIWVSTKAYVKGDVVTLDTADGLIVYDVKEESYICYNDLNGEHNPADAWVQTRKELEKNYLF